MAIITKPVGGILKGVPASISLSKSELSALSIIVADSYFSSTSNWNKVILKYRSSTGKQYEAVQFDATLSSPTGNFLVSIKARDTFEIQTIEIHDFDNDIFIVPRSALNVADFDVVLLSAPSSLSYSTPVTYTQNTAITNNVPTVTGTVTSYSILPALPTGLNFNTTTGVISGTPTEVSAAANYVVTASNGAGSTTATINITVEAAVPATNYINWDLLTGYQAGSLTITPTSGVSGGISLSGDDVAVKSDADKATGDFDYTFKFDWSSASSVNNMFAGVTGNNVTSGTSPLFYDKLTCIYGNGDNPDTANLWHNGSSVGGTTQTLLSGVNTYRLKRVGTTITHYLNDVQIYSATSTSFTAYPSVRTMGNSVVTESYITEAPIAVTWNVAGKTGVGTVTTGANGLITKSGGGSSYNVNVLSNETVIGDGYVEFINSSSFINVIFGIAEINDPSGFFSNIIIGGYNTGAAGLEKVYNDGTTFFYGGGVGSIAVGDVLRFGRVGTTYYIKINGTQVYSITNSNTNPVKASVTIYAENYGVNNVTISE